MHPDASSATPPFWSESELRTREPYVPLYGPLVTDEEAATGVIDPDNEGFWRTYIDAAMAQPSETVSQGEQDTSEHDLEASKPNAWGFLPIPPLPMYKLVSRGARCGSSTNPIATSKNEIRTRAQTTIQAVQDLKSLIAPPVIVDSIKNGSLSRAYGRYKSSFHSLTGSLASYAGESTDLIEGDLRSAKSSLETATREVMGTIRRLLMYDALRSYREAHRTYSAALDWIQNRNLFAVSSSARQNVLRPCKAALAELTRFEDGTQGLSSQWSSVLKMETVTTHKTKWEALAKEDKQTVQEQIQLAQL
ncbi:hypothetical protein IAU60_004336 [Kwoniella sp. DSM 27419]